MAFAVADGEVVSSNVSLLGAATEGHGYRRACFLFASVYWGEPAWRLALDQQGVVGGDAVGDIRQGKVGRNSMEQELAAALSDFDLLALAIEGEGVSDDRCVVFVDDIVLGVGSGEDNGSVYGYPGAEEGRGCYILTVNQGLVDSVESGVSDGLADDVLQEKKSASGRTGCVRTHQALGTLWTDPGRAHTIPNAKRTGNGNSDTATHGTVDLDAVCQGAVRAEAARHDICLPDGTCQGIFLLDAAMSGHFPSGRSCVRAFSFWAQPRQGKWRPDDTCHGTTVTLSVKAWNIVANPLVAFANTQRIPGIVTQSSSIHSI